MLRVLHVGLGPLGRIVVADLHGRRLGRLVGAVDPAAGLVGRPLADVVPGSSEPLLVSPSLSAALDGAEPPDVAIVTTSSDLAACAPTFRELLAAGLPVVSTCEELLYPRLAHAALADELHALALARGGRLLGAGVNPGFLMDALPLFATAPCRDVRSVRVERIQDAAPRRVPFQRKIGAGLSVSEFERLVAEGAIRHVGLPESLHFLAHHLGWTLDAWDEEIAPIVAATDLACDLGPIPAGRVAGVRQVARGLVGGRQVITMDFQAAIGQRDPRDRVLLEGEPPLELVIPGGVHGDIATSSLVLHVLGPLLAAPPGLHDMASIALLHWRAS